MLSEVIRDAIPYLKFPSSSFKISFTKALVALLDDAKASSYTPSSAAHEDAYEYLAAVIADIKLDELTNVDEEAVEAVAEVEDDDDEGGDEDFNFGN